MASNSTKSFLADAGYGEQELDANSALMELDKGIRKSGLSGWNGRGGQWRHHAVVAPGQTHAPSFPGRGRGRAPMLLVSLEHFPLWEIAGKLQCCWFAFAPAEQVVSSSDGPRLTAWGHSPPIFQAVCKNATFELWKYLWVRSVETRSYQECR